MANLLKKYWIGFQHPEENEDGAIIEAEVFGDGIKMWIRSQGELISEVSYR